MVWYSSSLVTTTARDALSEAILSAASGDACRLTCSNRRGSALGGLGLRSQIHSAACALQNPNNAYGQFDLDVIV